MDQLTPAQSWATVNPIWEKRSIIAATWLNDAPSVIDIGCGAQLLRDLLPETTRYLGVDVVERDGGTFVHDWNAAPLPFFASDHASVLGVLEYLDDVPGALRDLMQFDRVVVSYCHHGWFQSKAKRLQYWRNHYSARQFRRLLLDHGFRIVRRRRFRFAETIYEIHWDGAVQHWRNQ